MQDLSQLGSKRRIEVVLRVLDQAATGRPADSCLRDVLRQADGLDSGDRWWISQAVFDFHRWKGWVQGAACSEKNLISALELGDRFANEPASFPDDEIVSNAVPGWVAGTMEVKAEWVRTIQMRPVSLWLRSPSWAEHDFPGDVSAVTAGPLAGSWLFDGEQDLLRSRAFHSGLFEIQDISSQAVGHACGPKAGETWWDACAGEGGKTLHLSDLMQNRGLIWASDSAGWRLERLKRRAGRARVFNYRSASWDGTERLPTKGKFDGVLVDAPCSGIGTWQRNPHGRWTTVAADVQALSKLQTQLLNVVAGSIKPGGKLVYSVCTLTRAESFEVQQNFLHSHPEFEPLEFDDPFNSEAVKSDSRMYWPQEVAGQGMFIASWRRRN